jgi:hypothetical protein
MGLRFAARARRYDATSNIEPSAEVDQRNVARGCASGFVGSRLAGADLTTVDHWRLR